MRVPFRHLDAPRLRLFPLALALLSAMACTAPAQESHAKTTLVVLADQPMPGGFFPALSAALREELASGSRETQVLFQDEFDQGLESPSALNLQILREDEIVPGLVVGNTVTVHLHGSCLPAPSVQISALGNSHPTIPLGWVIRRNGLIEPSIHAACQNIGLILSHQAIGGNGDERNRLMAVAVSRVILHEWIHIATQSPAHPNRGLTKAQFGLSDLMPHPVTANRASNNDAHEKGIATPASDAEPVGGRR